MARDDESPQRAPDDDPDDGDSGFQDEELEDGDSDDFDRRCDEHLEAPFADDDLPSEDDSESEGELEEEPDEGIEAYNESLTHSVPQAASASSPANATAAREADPGGCATSIGCLILALGIAAIGLILLAVLKWAWQVVFG